MEQLNNQESGKTNAIKSVQRDVKSINSNNWALQLQTIIELIQITLEK